MTEPTFPRTFVVQRDEDVSGVSGEGVVAEGVHFSDGWVVTHWLDRPPMNEPKTDVWHNKGAKPFERVHGHGGATRILWADEVAARRRQLAADVVEAFDVPDWVGGSEAEQEVLRRQITRAIQAIQDGQAAPVEVGDERIVDAVMPTVVNLLEQRDRWRRAVGQAYQLAYHWQGAFGSANMLVRAAGTELLDTLTASEGRVHERTEDCTLDGWVDSDKLPAATECSAQYHGHRAPRQCIRAGQHRGDHIDERGFHWSDTVAVYPLVDGKVKYGRVPAANCANPDHACGSCGNCVNQHPGEGGCFEANQLPPNQGPLTGIEVRDPCPYCESCPLIPRQRMAEHIHDNHPEVRIGSRENGAATAAAGPTARHDLQEVELLQAEIARLREGEEPYTEEGVVPTPGQWIWRWNRLTAAKRQARATQILEMSVKSFDCVMADHEGAVDELRTTTAALTRATDVVNTWVDERITAADAGIDTALRHVVKLKADLYETLGRPLSPIATCDEHDGVCFPRPGAQCSAHGQEQCKYCHRHPDNCAQGGNCGTWVTSGMHWDTCANRVRGQLGLRPPKEV